MSTIKVMVEKKVCDFCDSKCDCYYQCAKCGKDVCWECKKIVGTEYSHAVYFSGSGDGFYCYECDTTDKPDKKHSLYRQIKMLMNERQAYEKDFNERRKLVEEKLKEINDDS